MGLGGGSKTGSPPLVSAGAENGGLEMFQQRDMASHAPEGIATEPRLPSAA
jgi:hypothetical protein